LLSFFVFVLFVLFLFWKRLFFDYSSIYEDLNVKLPLLFGVFITSGEIKVASPELELDEAVDKTRTGKTHPLCQKNDKINSKTFTLDTYV